MTESLILNKGIKGMSLVNSIIIFGQELFEFMCIIPGVWYLRSFFAPILKSVRLVLTLLSIKNINNQQNEKNNFNTF